MWFDAINRIRAVLAERRDESEYARGYAAGLRRALKELERPTNYLQRRAPVDDLDV